MVMEAVKVSLQVGDPGELLVEFRPKTGRLQASGRADVLVGV